MFHQGDDVKKGDNLISFDMTLVEMELNIAKLKLQKQEQDLARAQKRLVSLQNGGPIEDNTDSTDDTGLDSVSGDTGGDSEMSTSNQGSDGSADDSMQSITGSVPSAADGNYLASAAQPLLLSVFTEPSDTAVQAAETAQAESQLQNLQKIRPGKIHLRMQKTFHRTYPPEIQKVKAVRIQAMLQMLLMMPLPDLLSRILQLAILQMEVQTGIPERMIRRQYRLHRHLL